MYKQVVINEISAF